MIGYVFFPGPKRNIVTGGERFYFEVIRHFNKHELHCVSVADAPRIFRNVLMFNIWLIWYMRDKRQNVLILDFYSHPRCFLAAWFIKFFCGCKIFMAHLRIGSKNWQIIDN